MTDLDLDAIKARAEAATPGPLQSGLGWVERTHRNAVFLAHACEDVPALIAEIERLRAEMTATYVQAIDFDDTLIWQDRDHRELGYTEPDYAGDVPETWAPLYRRVTEPAGSVTP